MTFPRASWRREGERGGEEEVMESVAQTEKHKCMVGGKEGMSDSIRNSSFTGVFPPQLLTA